MGAGEEAGSARATAAGGGDGCAALSGRHFDPLIEITHKNRTVTLVCRSVCLCDFYMVGLLVLWLVVLDRKGQTGGPDVLWFVAEDPPCRFEFEPFLVFGLADGKDSHRLAGRRRGGREWRVSLEWVT